MFDRDKMKMLYLKGKRLYSYGYPKANFVGDFTEYFPFNREEYEKKKQIEIAKQAKKKKTHRWFEQRNKLIKYMFTNFLKELKVDARWENIAQIVGGLSYLQVRDICYDKLSEEEDQN